MTPAVEQLAAALADRYLIESELGRGASATVYLAHDLRHDRRVALKVLHSALGAALGVERFLREIRTAARLQHPNIVPLFDSGSAAGQLFYSMPYVESGSLRDRIKSYGPLPVPEAIQLALEVADALAHAHHHGVVHRDIKPGNILLEAGHAVVADFGIARAISEAAGEEITASGLVVGTPAYMSPEQSVGGTVDGRSDVYALGCVLYEMLAGEPPFTGPTPQVLAARHFHDPPPPLRTVRPAVTTVLESVVLRALEKLPGDRFATAEEFRAALVGSATAPLPRRAVRGVAGQTMTATAERLAAALADRYIIETELGRGSSATVYLAQDLRHDRWVALKVLHSALGAALGVERFLREIRTAARLQHPHILPLFDSGSADGQLFYTMPFVETGSLRDRLNRQGPLPVPAAIQLALEVASALTYAHALGVIHRDIKPENILLTQTGDPLLSDFGIAYAIDSGADGHGGSKAEGRLTETGITLGTPAYMSPEQSAGDEPVDVRSDLYSLAAVIFEVLAGRPPFTGPNARSIITRRLVEPPPSLQEIRPDVPPAVDRALTLAMARHPVDRFESVAEFAEALAGESAVAAPGGRSSHLPRRFGLWAGLVLVATAAGVLGVRYLFSGAEPKLPTDVAGPRVLVVLPFKNLGSPADQYFADGLTEEITSRLAGLSGLRVISRTSADQYRESKKSLKEIGAELRAGYVLEGNVRWERSRGAGPGRIRVAPSLIQVSNETRLWSSEPYEAELTEVFRIQSEIAEQVTTALDVALRAPEREALAAVETRNAEAYDFYLRGNDYLGRSNQQADLINAANLYQRAVETDSTFGVAYAKLARCHTQIYWHYYDRTEARLELARNALAAAARLAPDLPETHMARGYYHYWGELDYDGAMREFAAALRRQPSNSELLQAMGYVERRRGRWEESLARFVEALRYDPRSGIRSFDVGDNYYSLRMYPEAEHYLERAMTLSPDWPNPYVYRAWMYVSWSGDLPRGRAVLGQALNRIEAGRLAPALQTGDRMSASLVTADSAFWPMLDGLSLTSFAGDSVRYHLLKAEADGFRGARTAERAHGDSARVLLERRLAPHPDDAKLLAGVALAYSHMGRHRDAVRAGERSAELLPLSQDAVSGPFILAYLARVYIAAGAQDKAIDLLERLLAIPSWVSPAELRADPTWAALRSHPRFQRLAGS
jgi:serine/threonine protein kinase/TolB-like protein